MTADRKSKFAISTLAATSMFVIALIIGGGATGIVLNAQNQQAPQGVSTTITASSNSSTSQAGVGYTLTLLIANNQYFNSTLGAMPRYYVLGSNGSLESSANISVPDNTLVKLVIVNYDDGGNNVSSALATVTGTVGSSELFFNGTSNSAADVQNVSSNGVVAHTFSIGSLGLNVPVPFSSTVVTYVNFGEPGTYVWNCFTPCMPWQVMSTAKGWMTGTFNVVA
ncbi:MAG: hypothetical protein ACYCPW_02630 [Nitrososphaerales archaeon]